MLWGGKIMIGAIIVIAIIIWYWKSATKVGKNPWAWIVVGAFSYWIPMVITYAVLMALFGSKISYQHSIEFVIFTLIASILVGIVVAKLVHNANLKSKSDNKNQNIESTKESKKIITHTNVVNKVSTNIFIWNANNIKSTNYGLTAQGSIVKALRNAIKPDSTKIVTFDAQHGDLMKEVVFGDSPMISLKKWITSDYWTCNFEYIDENTKTAFQKGDIPDYIPYLIVINLDSNKALDTHNILIKDKTNGYVGLLTIYPKIELYTIENDLSLPKVNIQITSGISEPENPDVRILLKKAWEEKDNHKVLEICNRIFTLDANCSEGYRAKGVALEGLDRIDDAEQAYRKAAECDPNNASALYSLASILHVKQGRYLEAASLYEKVIALKPPFMQQAIQWRKECLFYAKNEN